MDTTKTTKFDPEAWARTVPHSFYSHWPRATMTKCDYCGVYSKDHPADVADEQDVAKHPVTALRAAYLNDVDDDTDGVDPRYIANR